LNRKLLIIAGAGGSVQFGLPSVGEVDKLLDTCASSWYPLDTDVNSNLYRYVRDAVDAYYAQIPKPALRKQANFEEVLYQLYSLVPHYSDPAFTHGANALLQAMKLPDVRMQGRTPAKAVDGHTLRHLASVLIDAIVDDFINKSARAAAAKTQEIELLRTFFSALSEEFDIGFITLNYDNIIMQALPGLFTGFDASGNFDPLSVVTREDWRFIYHLHGSIHFAMKGTSGDIHRISWEPRTTSNHVVQASGRNTQASLEGMQYPTSPIIAGYGKTVQLLRQPFITYFAQANKLAHEADSLLFLGYGFADPHLNATFSEVRKRRRPAVVVTWGNDDPRHGPIDDALAWRMDTWSRNLLSVLPANQTNMSLPGYCVPLSIKEYKEAAECEVSNDDAHPLAIWYGGMLEACKHPEKILSYLR